MPGIQEVFDGTTHKSPEHTQIELEHQSSYDRDRDELARLGKKQVLKRNFGFMSMLGFSCTIMVTWEGMLVLFLAGYQNGGPAGLIYGFLFVWVGTLCVFTTLGELASMAPTSGGQYYWVAMLAPPSSRRFLSYITGWLNVIGWQAFLASGAYLCATIIQGLIVLNYPEYNAQRWHGTLLLWSVICVAVLVNTVIVSLLPKLECVILIIHVLGFFAVMIPLVYMAPHGSAKDVFTLFVNGGGWQTTGLSFFVGLYGNVFAFLGTDAAIHMSEEITNASTNVPRSMLVSVLLNGTLGFAMLVAVLFCSGDITAEAIIETPTGYPFIAIFVQATQSVGGSTGMAVVIVSLGICATIAFLASASRMTWAFARDRGLPMWRYLSKVEPRSSIPLVSILTTVTISCLLALINIGSDVAFNGVISLTINGLYSSYLLAAGLLLWRRCTGSISLPTTYESNPKIVTEGEAVSAQGTINLTWGPFRFPGPLGIAINIVGCLYMLIIVFFSFWPPTREVDAATMNYSVLVTGFWILFSIVYYFAYAKRIYKGPLMEI
ncbi:MAG: hypothetical protein L6R38_008013 [Xanthoria sp. 2 TBL-2021]|nr:MAG: hypothetical protein L6R38_008013 [Xanthoria sp. 2 TBL-2021]